MQERRALERRVVDLDRREEALDDKIDDQKVAQWTQSTQQVSADRHAQQIICAGGWHELLQVGLESVVVRCCKCSHMHTRACTAPMPSHMQSRIHPHTRARAQAEEYRKRVAECQVVTASVRREAATQRAREVAR